MARRKILRALFMLSIRSQREMQKRNKERRKRDYTREELNGFSFFITKEELMSNQNNSMKEDVNVEEQKTVLTIKETAKEFNFPEYAIRTLVKRGAFPVIQAGSRCYIMKHVFESYLQTGGEQYAAAPR